MKLISISRYILKSYHQRVGCQVYPCMFHQFFLERNSTGMQILLFLQELQQICFIIIARTGMIFTIISGTGTIFIIIFMKQNSFRCAPVHFELCKHHRLRKQTTRLQLKLIMNLIRYPTTLKRPILVENNIFPYEKNVLDS